MSGSHREPRVLQAVDGIDELSPAEKFCLFALYHYGPLTTTELTEITHLLPRTVRGNAGRLEEEIDAVEVRHSPTDPRTLELHLEELPATLPDPLRGAP